MTRSGYLLDLVVFFEFGGAAVAQGAVQPGAVVPGDVLHDSSAGGCLSGPGVLVDALALEGGEERLGQGGVPALTGPADGQGDGAVVGGCGVLRGGVLAAAVGVEHDAVGGVACRDGVAQRVGDQVGA